MWKARVMNTKLLYLENFSLLTCEAQVIDVQEENPSTGSGQADRDVVVLDQTVLYAQGGGQPYDKGTIESPNAKFLVEEVRYFDGIVKHIGRFENKTLKKGDKVICHVDKPRRDLNSKIHSAGHVVDTAVVELKLPWAPIKGYHFPEGPYVEYSGELNETEKETLKTNIENLCNKFIAEGRDVKPVFMNVEQMKSICHFVPDNIPANKPARVIMFGDFGMPCGGTHVANISQIKQMIVRKIKTEGLQIRVGYDVTRQ